MSSDYKTDYRSEALDRLLSTLKGDDTIDAWIASYVDRVQEFEDAAHPMLFQRDVDVAEGAQLDGLGVIVGEPRGGRDDTIYRIFLRCRIIVNNSRSRAKDLIDVVTARSGFTESFGNVDFDEYYPRTIYIRAKNLKEEYPDVVAGLLNEARPAGYTLFYIYSLQSNNDNVFRFSSGATSDTGVTWGFSSGKLAGAA